jgi:hypothetical protein
MRPLRTFPTAWDQLVGIVSQEWSATPQPYSPVESITEKDWEWIGIDRTMYSSVSSIGSSFGAVSATGRKRASSRVTQ